MLHDNAENYDSSLQPGLFSEKIIMIQSIITILAVKIIIQIGYRVSDGMCIRTMQTNNDINTKGIQKHRLDDQSLSERREKNQFHAVQCVISVWKIQNRGFPFQFGPFQETGRTRLIGSFDSVLNIVFIQPRICLGSLEYSAK